MKIRNPNIETRNNIKIQNGHAPFFYHQNSRHRFRILGFDHLNLFRISNFEFNSQP